MSIKTKFENEERIDTLENIKSTMKVAISSGLAGSVAMIIQVCTLMWLQTTMTYQYCYGTTTTQTLKKLYAEGGIRRFYRGIVPALFEGSIMRFGDTAANTGTLKFFSNYPIDKDLPISIKMLCASTVASAFRILLMPIDTFKIILQVEGEDGLRLLWRKYKNTGNIAVFWHGSLAATSATFVGYYPWFATFNYLDEKLPPPDSHSKLQKLIRRAFQGFAASIVSDTFSNSLYVIKTTRQASIVPLTYTQAINTVIKKEGYIELFTRGLKTRFLINGLQGLLFSILWKTFEESFTKKKNYYEKII